jgi:hypothetical protein
VGSIPASRTKIRFDRGLKSNLQALFLCSPGFIFAPHPERLVLAGVSCLDRARMALLDLEGVMANDERIEVRVSLLEYQMETVVDIVKEIRANYVTREYLDQRLSHYATRAELEKIVQSSRNWVIGVVLSASALQFAVNFAMLQIYLHNR